ncbi:hypothetical protein [Caldimonas brevitalea]|uniref:Uncharacterized protein n=1 Tax=Caldimonas brevitalea TaxID=413882 RepID=A0A0G3BDJ5_9BURK|nr:hypothetical protein [Caldimonas brevitalea]AKJ27474.1 hypothetical protein AAW51_0783 [Caldimonas brevitalea]
MTTFQGMHIHALRRDRFTYRGEYEVTGREAQWSAQVWLGETLVEEPRGIAPFDSADMDPVKAVMAQLHAKIDALDAPLPR